MSIITLSIKRPVFIISIILLMIVAGSVFMNSMGVDLYPEHNLPVVVIDVPYPGAGPDEIANKITKPLEDSISAISGLKRITSTSNNGVSEVIAEFTFETNTAYAQQQVRDKLALARTDFPKDIEEPIVSIVDLNQDPVLTVSVESKLPEDELFDLLDKKVRPALQQIPQVGMIEILGTRKREIGVELSLKKLNERELSAVEVASGLELAGKNVPAGSRSDSRSEVFYRTMGEFGSLKDISDSIVHFEGNDVPVRIRDIGTVRETFVDEKSRTFVDGRKTSVLAIYKQSGSNTVKVAGSLKKRIPEIQSELTAIGSPIKLQVVTDGSTRIDRNISDVKETILIGILLTVLVVFLFLGNIRSVIITGLAIPNSLLGAFLFMHAFGFTVNILTLLALSLSVGLLIDDAIVVCENIFRHVEHGEDSFNAAVNGTTQVAMAVTATTLVIVSVFLPIAFMKGVVGQFFKEFGLTVCFVMLISLLDSLTIAPMLSAYFVKKEGVNHTAGKFQMLVMRAFRQMDKSYEKILALCMRKPYIPIIAGVVIFAVSMLLLVRLPKTFMPPDESGEVILRADAGPAASLEESSARAMELDRFIRKDRQVDTTFMKVGTSDGDASKISISIRLAAKGKRNISTSMYMKTLRAELNEFSSLSPIVTMQTDSGNERQFTVYLVGDNYDQLKEYANAFYERFKKHPALLDPELSEKPGKQELRVVFDDKKTVAAGISKTSAGAELRTLIEGEKPTVFRRNGEEYKVRVHLTYVDRDLSAKFSEMSVPNINGRLIKLPSIAHLDGGVMPSAVKRIGRGRCISFMADINPSGPGLASMMDDMDAYFKSEKPLPSGMHIEKDGDSEYFDEMKDNLGMAMLLGVFFIYLVLASLYESFLTPLAIMLVIPLAICGAIYALYITNSTIDIYSMIGCTLLMGIATKNSILLVDRIRQNTLAGRSTAFAVMEAAKVRMRPIIMTSMALIAGMIPVAVGLNEVSVQRVSMGIAVIGGMISSTALSLLIVPASYMALNWVRVKIKYKKISDKNNE